MKRETRREAAAALIGRRAMARAIVLPPAADWTAAGGGCDYSAASA
ncbi:MAG: hypothetical protein ACU0A4_00125 [Paracoccaceae bacterium]